MKATSFIVIIFILTVTICIVRGQAVCGKDAGNALCTQPNAPCCSQYGYCGSTSEYCGTGCQSGCDGVVGGETTCSNTTLKAPETSGNNGTGDTCSIRYTISECDLAAMMEYQCTNCSGYLPYIIAAMERYDLNCPVRIATFLAQVRHETAALSTFYQPADNGAGAIHMIPANYRVACAQIPEMTQAFTDAFPSCSSSNKCECGTDPEASVIVGRPELAFLTGGWWFKTGSEQMLGYQGCGDLRLDADVGKGTESPSTGYYEVSRCIFGSLNVRSDQGLSQRLAYFDAAWNVAKNFGQQNISPSASTPSTNNSPSSTNNQSPSSSNNSPSGSNNPLAKSSSASSLVSTALLTFLVLL